YKMRPGVWVLMICFLLLPFISWLYIRQGVDFRLNALKELNQRISIAGLDSLYINDYLVNRDSLRGRVWVFINADKISDIEENKNLARTIYDQNDGSKAVGIVYCSEKDLSTQLLLNPILTKRHFVSFAPERTFERLFNLFSANDSLKADLKTVNSLVMDNKGFIRKGYDLTNEKEVVKLLQHSAVLIPDYKREKPQLVRQDGY
ncbi:MAG: hypothetical protein KBD43_08685, partial [Saprospiraceae bacterium]|nr:hypothetical protein [Saprospiraceae bacterium]